MAKHLFRRSGPSGGIGDTVTDSSENPSLPAEVRRRLITIASDVMGNRPLAELPSAVRRFARFAPAKRVRLGASEIAAALAGDADFRESLGDAVSDASPELVQQVSRGHPPAAADPVDVGVIAYLLRPPGWHDQLDRVAELLAAQGRRRSSEGELTRLRADLERITQANLELIRARDAARAVLKSATADQAAELAELRRQLRAAQAEARAAGRAEQDATLVLADVRADRERLEAAASGELRKARARIAALETDLDSARRQSRAGREHDDARVWVLLETLGAAAAGLRRELDVATPDVRPADSVAAGRGVDPGRPSVADGPLLDRMLGGAHVHLIVDGYNLTKTGYGTLPLSDQRSRLVSSLGALAARTGVEVTVAFDGTAAPTGLAGGVPSPRGVRVLFSAPGQLADDLIQDLLRAEPPGRTVVVASSDQAVASSVRAAGAWPTPAQILLSRLERG